MNTESYTLTVEIDVQDVPTLKEAIEVMEKRYWDDDDYDKVSSPYVIEARRHTQEDK